MVVTIYGVCAITFMMVMYALESRGGRYVLGFALGCVLSSVYGFWSGAWPFGIVELVWSGVALRRYRDRLTVPGVDELAVRLQTAFNARDIDALRSLLAEDVTWGEDPESESFCHNRHDVIAHVTRLLDEGIRATIVDVMTSPRGIAARLHVDWPAPEDQRPHTVHQTYLVTDGLVTEIHGHDDRESALAAIS